MRPITPLLFFGKSIPAIRAIYRVCVVLKNLQKYKLLLPLFELRVLFVDNEQLALAADNLAVSTSFFDGCSYFHLFEFIGCGLPLFYLLISEGYSGFG